MSLVRWIVTTVLVLLVSTCCATIQDPPLLRQLRARYEILLKHLEDTPNVDPRFAKIRDKVAIITGIASTRMNKGTIGYNVNKGYEIYICLDGDNVNAAMHVLIHELAHITVPEYDHSDAFWQSFKDLKSLCQTLGLYTPITTVKYCGGEIHE